MPLRPHRLHPAYRGRSELLCGARDPRYGRLTQTKLPPENQGRFNKRKNIAVGRLGTCEKVMI